MSITPEINLPGGLNFDNDGNLLICQSGAVREINPSTGIINTIAGKFPPTTGVGDGRPADSALVDAPYSISVDPTGNLYIGDYWTSTIREVNISTDIINDYAGTTLMAGSSGDGGLATAAKISSVLICIDTIRSRLYISDEWNHKIRMVDMTTGIITTFAGTGVSGYSGDGGLADTARFSRVLGLTLDHYGNLYIGDWDNERIRKVDITTGIITTYAGNGTVGYGGDSGFATSAMIDGPVALCFDKCGNLVFADEFNNRVRKIDATTGIITTIAGNGIAGFTGDSGVATAAELNNPSGVCFDDSNNLYISDYYNNRVRKVNYTITAITLTDTLTISQADTLCLGTSVTFTASATASSGTITYQWYVNGSVVSTTGSSYTYTPANGDSIRCVATAANACTSAITGSNTIYMVVTPFTTPTITIAATTSAPIGATVTVTATVAGAGSSYNINWYDNTVLFSTTTVPVVTYTKGAGTDNITATVVPSGEVGCYDSTTSTAFTVTVSNAGITAPSGQRAVTVYPNPAHEEITIAGQNITNVTICNLLGQTMITQDCNCNEVSINIAILSAGVYAVKVTDSEGGKTVSKIVKQ